LTRNPFSIRPIGTGPRQDQGQHPDGGAKKKHGEEGHGPDRPPGLRRAQGCGHERPTQVESGQQPKHRQPPLPIAPLQAAAAGDWTANTPALQAAPGLEPKHSRYRQAGHPAHQQPRRTLQVRYPSSQAHSRAEDQIACQPPPRGRSPGGRRFRASRAASRSARAAVEPRMMPGRLIPKRNQVPGLLTARVWKLRRGTR